MIKDAVNEAYLLCDHKVKRKDLFFSCKLWNIHHSKDMVMLGLNDSLANLGLDYLDLYVMSSPMGFKVSTLKYGLFILIENNKIIFKGKCWYFNSS